MAVLKSFELLGNKLSFSNWISNLSPKTTPFTSMIGKEAIDQVQYSWQTDSLAPASRETFEEGSQAESQKRASTKVFTNFTTIIRKAIKVTDTNEATSAYGRRDELAYQMGKAGNEVLRDVEAMNLSERSARKGSDTTASRSAGFKNLCAPLFVPDVDTFAMTHHLIAVKDPQKKWFNIKDVFNVTTNLFLSGSKADKIMFHPHHIGVFSDLLGYNEEDPLVFRLFDNLDERYNMAVSKIRDPLGRVYTLIPNRMMPVSEVYFFHESDWTQMVLRAPATTDLGRKGSSKAVMIETELGLRHRHPYASGVLSTMAVAYTSELTVDRDVITTIEGDRATFTIALKELDGSVAANQIFDVAISDPSLGELETTSGQTGVDGTAKFWLKGKKEGRVVVYVYRYDVDKGLISLPITITILPATVEITGADHEMAMGERLSLEASVISPINPAMVAPVGTDVVWHTNSKDIFFISSTGDFVPDTITIPTGDTFKSKVDIAARFPGQAEVWATSSSARSDGWDVNVIPAGLKFEWDDTVNRDLFTVGVENKFLLSVLVKDRHGSPVPDTAVISWSLENSSRGTLGKPTPTAAGRSTCTFTPDSAGETYLILEAYGDVYKHKITCMNPAVTTVIKPSNTMKIGQTCELHTFVTDAHGGLVVGKVVHWVADPTSFVEIGGIQGTTGSDGIAKTTIRGVRLGSGVVETTIDGIKYAPCKYFVGTGAELVLDINPNPTKINHLTTFTATLVGSDGVGLEGVEITFTSDPLVGDLSTMNGPTIADGTHQAQYTPAASEPSVIRASATGFDCIGTRLMDFEDAEYTYETDDDTNITIGIGREHPLQITVRDETGTLVGGVQLEYTISDVHKGRLTVLNGGKTNGSGQSLVRIEPIAKGPISLSVKVKGRSNSQTFHMEIKDPKLGLTINPNPIVMNAWATVAGVLLDANDSPVDNVLIGFNASPTSGAEVLIATPKTTGIDGAYTLDWKVITNSDYEIYSYIHGHPSVQSAIVNLVVNDPLLVK